MLACLTSDTVNPRSIIACTASPAGPNSPITPPAPDKAALPHCPAIAYPTPCPTPATRLTPGIILRPCLASNLDTGFANKLAACFCAQGVCIPKPIAPGIT